MTSRSSTCGAGPEIARGARPNAGVREVQKFGSERAWNEQLQKAARMLTINQIVPEFDLLPLKFPGFEFLCLPQTGFQITESLFAPLSELSNYWVGGLGVPHLLQRAAPRGIIRIFPLVTAYMCRICSNMHWLGASAPISGTGSISIGVSCNTGHDKKSAIIIQKACRPTKVLLNCL